jgi:hypothetical protein
MSVQTLFRLTRWTLATSVILTIAAMVVYPGGTLLDPRVPRYSFFQNFPANTYAEARSCKR